jgi:hypothetical protein
MNNYFSLLHYLPYVSGVLPATSFILKIPAFAGMTKGLALSRRARGIEPDGLPFSRE